MAAYVHYPFINYIDGKPRGFDDSITGSMLIVHNPDMDEIDADGAAWTYYEMSITMCDVDSIPKTSLIWDLLFAEREVVHAVDSAQVNTIFEWTPQQSEYKPDNVTGIMELYGRVPEDNAQYGGELRRVAGLMVDGDNVAVFKAAKMSDDGQLVYATSLVVHELTLETTVGVLNVLELDGRGPQHSVDGRVVIDLATVDLSGLLNEAAMHGLPLEIKYKIREIEFATDSTLLRRLWDQTQAWYYGHRHLAGAESDTVPDHAAAEARMGVFNYSTSAQSFKWGGPAPADYFPTPTPTPLPGLSPFSSSSSSNIGDDIDGLYDSSISGAPRTARAAGLVVLSVALAGMALLLA
jgi:hypothetical protein